MLNVNGGDLDRPSVRHDRCALAGHVLIEGKRRGARYAVVTMRIAGGMGAAGLFEIF